MILGIIGSIGSGKTTAAKIFSKYHFNRIDADEIGHKIIEKNTVAYKKIIKNFGNGILNKNKNIERKKLGDVVFNDYKKLKMLNSIMHPIIINKIKNNIEKIQKKCGSKTKIVIDAPLLFETETKHFVDKIIVINCNAQNIIKRLNKKYPKEKIERILNAQMPPEEKLKYADFIVDNNQDLKHLENQVKEVIKKLEFY